MSRSRPMQDAPSKTDPAAGDLARLASNPEDAPAPLPSHQAPLPGRAPVSGGTHSFERFRQDNRFHGHGARGAGPGAAFLRQHKTHGRGA